MVTNLDRSSLERLGVMKLMAFCITVFACFILCKQMTKVKVADSGAGIVENLLLTMMTNDWFSWRF